MTSQAISNKIKIFSAFFIFLINSCSSSIVLDFSTVEANLRIVGFNTKAQQLVHFEQMTPQNVTRPLYLFLTQFYQEPAIDIELSYSIQYTTRGIVRVNPTDPALRNILHPKEHYIIMSDSPIESTVGGVVNYIANLKKWVWLSSAIQERSPTQIKQIVPPITKEGSGDFAIAHTDPNTNLLKLLKKDEKWLLGEMLTRITMYSFGYNVQTSLYEGNHGLDGIFTGFNNGFIIITQSKMGNSNPRAPTVMKDELNEPHICTRLGLMRQKNNAELLASANLITDKLEVQPGNVFKMAHCILDKGKGQVALEVFNIEKAPRDMLKLYGSPEETKTKTIADDLVMFSADPRDRFKLALKAANRGISQADAMSLLLESMGLPAERHVEYLRLIERDFPETDEDTL